MATRRRKGRSGIRKEEKGSSDPIPAVPAPPPPAAARKLPEIAAEAGVVAVDNTGALPLKPPIYQCEVGHVVCSLCCDKLKATGKCHVCRRTTGGFRRRQGRTQGPASLGACPGSLPDCPWRNDLDNSLAG
ncbi:unnamed protein product [Urochloa humidicola]